LVTLRDGTQTQTTAYVDTPIEEFDASELSTTLTPSLTTPSSQTRCRLPPKTWENMVQFSSESENEPDSEDSEFK
jgi:hypothetical protein